MNIKRNIIVKRVVSLLVVIMLICTSLCTIVFATETDEKIVRVGYIDYHEFIEKNSDGAYSGYGVDYLNEISKYTGYKYEYVYGEWSELLEKLKNREIDFLCNAQYSNDRAEKFDYSAYPIGYTQGLLYAKKENDISYEDYKSFEGMNVGVIKNNAINALFLKYAESNNFGCNLKEYSTENSLIKALNSGGIDAICCEHLANHHDLSLLANFGSDAYYIISYKNSPYIDEVNFALRQIKTNVDFETDLYHEHYDSSAAESAMQLTEQEKEYIASAKVLNVGFMPDRSPLSYRDEDGNAKGMLVDLMDIVSEKSGLKFNYKFLKVGETGYNYLTKKGGDVVVGVASSAFSEPNPQLLQSDSLLSSSIVFVGKEGMSFSPDSHLTIAIPTGFINGKQVISEKYPNLKFYNAKNNDDCLNAIRDGKADIMLQNMYIVRECLESPLYNKLAIFPAYSFPENEKVVSLPKNEILISIINKIVALISDEQTSNIVINNTIAKPYHTSFAEFIYEYRFYFIGVLIFAVIIIGMLFVHSTTRQKNYNRIQKLNSQLENANLKLGDAVKQADRSNAAKSQFLSRMSHEIRTPMNAIVGLTAIAKKHEEEAEKIDDYLGKIETSSRVLLNIINDVLDMSAIESNKLKIANEEFDIKQVLNSIATIYFSQCENKGITFEMSTDIQNEILIGDSLRVNQILLNLVSNAYKFTDKGGVIHISVKETIRNDNVAFIRFIVSDTGAGMSDDMIERLFKPFEQETVNTTQKYGGSGLGLSIAKNLVDMMHGAITVKSKKDIGTSFTVDIPFKIVLQENQLNNKALKNLRVLLVDDDATSLEYASIVLKRIGTAFDTANSGKQALQMIKNAENDSKPYNAVITDWNMPDMNCIEIARKIRSSKKNKATIIIVSAYDINQVEDEAKEAGINLFVSKPLFQSTVFDTLISLTQGTMSKSKKKLSNYNFTGHRVILAEDNALNSEIAIELLHMVNLEVDYAQNGEKAVEIYKNSQPGTYDAILMDIQMPIMDGYEATKVIRALDRADAKSIHIFAMTANAFTEDVSLALSVGMNGHIAKPINTKILYQTLDKLFSEHLGE